MWGVSISPVHNMVATSSSDKTARLWSLDRTFPVRILAGHTFDVMVNYFTCHYWLLVLKNPEDGTKFCRNVGKILIFFLLYFFD